LEYELEHVLEYQSEMVLALASERLLVLRLDAASAPGSDCLSAQVWEPALDEVSLVLRLALVLALVLDSLLALEWELE